MMWMTALGLDDWKPDGAHDRADVRPGDLVAFDYGAWRVVSVTEIPLARWTPEQRDVVVTYKGRTVPLAVVLRPAGQTGPDRDRVCHAYRGITAWSVYASEHYPVCGKCHQPVPCLHQHAVEVAERAAKALEPYLDEGICPACRKPVTAGQDAVTFENVKLPGGPDVTFHTRPATCLALAQIYEREWAAAAPGRHLSLSCRGRFTGHGDGTYSCTQGAACPGPLVDHDAYAECFDGVDCCPKPRYFCPDTATPPTRRDAR